MACKISLAFAVFGTIAIVKGTYIDGRFDNSYSDNGFDEAGSFVGDVDGFGSDSSWLHDIGPYMGDGVRDRGIGESLSAGVLGRELVDPDFGVSPKYAGIPRIRGGIGGIQQGITGGILGGRRSRFGKYGRRRVMAGIAGFARRPRRVVGMGGILGVRRRSWKLY